MARKPTGQELRRFEASGDKRGLIRKYLNSGGDLTTGLKAVGAAKGPATWYEGDGWSSYDSLINGAYWVMFGREVDPSGLAEYRQGDWDGQSLAFNLSGSQEFISNGGDPAWLGNTEVDVSTLNADERAYYDVWRANNPDAVFRESDRNYINWSMDAMSLDAFTADQTGQIQHSTGLTETGDPINFSIVSEDAVTTMGGDLTGLYGNRAGDLIYAPTGLQTNKQTVTGDPLGPESGFDGMSIYSTTGHMSSGFGDWVGDVTGSSELGDLAGEAATAVVSSPVIYTTGAIVEALGVKEGVLLQDPFNIATPLTKGQAAGVKHQSELYDAADTFGVDPETYAKVQGYGRLGATVALGFVPGIGPLVAAAFASAGYASDAQMGYMDWSDAGIYSAAAFASAGIQSAAAQPAGPVPQTGALQVAAAGAGVASTITAPAAISPMTAALLSAGVDAGTVYAVTGDSDAALKAGAWSAAGSAASTYTQSAASSMGLSGAFTQAGVVAGTSALVGSIREAVDSDYTYDENALASDLVQAAASGALGGDYEGGSADPRKVFGDWAIPRGTPRDSIDVILDDMDRIKFGS